MKNSALKGNILIAVLIFVVLATGTFLLFKPRLSSTQYQSTQTRKSGTTNDFQGYTSQDLKISFKYPKGWFVDEKDFDIMITSYMAKIGENKSPNANEIKIFIDNYSGCFPTLEEDLIDPACGQGKFKNKIISKEVKQAPNGEFLKYTLDSYDENQRTQYFFQKGEKILDIEKHPDPSQFEKEFEAIVNSLRFL